MAGNSQALSDPWTSQKHNPCPRHHRQGTKVLGGLHSVCSYRFFPSTSSRQISSSARDGWTDMRPSIRASVMRKVPVHTRRPARRQCSPDPGLICTTPLRRAPYGVPSTVPICQQLRLCTQHSSASRRHCLELDGRLESLLSHLLPKIDSGCYARLAPTECSVPGVLANFLYLHFARRDRGHPSTAASQPAMLVHPAEGGGRRLLYVRT